MKTSKISKGMAMMARALDAIKEEVRAGELSDGQLCTLEESFKDLGKSIALSMRSEG